MPFEREPVRTPARIARVTLNIAVLKSDTGVVSYDDGTTEIGIGMSDGSVVTKFIANLNQHLTAAQRTSVKNFLDAMLLKAETEIL